MYYQVQFQKNKDKDVLALLNSESEVNAMTPTYGAQLDLKVQKTNINMEVILGMSFLTLSNANV